MPKESRNKKFHWYCTDYGIPGIFSEIVSLKCINSKPRFHMFYNESRVSSLKKKNSCKNMNKKYVAYFSEKQIIIQWNGKIIRNVRTMKLESVIFIWNTVCPGHVLWSILQSQEFRKVQTTMTKINQVVIIINFSKGT